jgi:hypothetical protein
VPTNEGVLARLVLAAIEAQEHPDAAERTEALHEMAVVLEHLVHERLEGAGAWDPQWDTLDGMRIERFGVRGPAHLTLEGAFYVLHTTGHRMLPVLADLQIGDRPSVVRVADRGSQFEMPVSDRQFQRGFDAARWGHSVRLDLPAVGDNDS